jgi:hypothetical protein
MRIFPQIPPNSPVHFPMKILCLTTIFNPQYLDIWFMSSELSQPTFATPSTSSPHKDNHMVIVTNVTSPDTLHSHIFHCDEDILEELTTLDFPFRFIQQINIKLHLPLHGVLLHTMSCLLNSRTLVRHSNGP